MLAEFSDPGSSLGCLASLEPLQLVLNCVNEFICELLLLSSGARCGWRCLLRLWCWLPFINLPPVMISSAAISKTPAPQLASLTYFCFYSSVASSLHLPSRLTPLLYIVERRRSILLPDRPRHQIESSRATAVEFSREGGYLSPGIRTVRQFSLGGIDLPLCGALQRGREDIFGHNGQEQETRSQ